jgi:cobyrinic acid a,c-diamide synthase
MVIYISWLTTAYPINPLTNTKAHEFHDTKNKQTNKETNKQKTKNKQQTKNERKCFQRSYIK